MAREAAASLAALYVTGGTLGTKLAFEFLELTAAQSWGRWRWLLQARSIPTPACGGAPPST